ncbi:MAG: C40 family peptidase, partial [Nonlabens sp.]
VAPLRVEASHRSEMVSQVLYGESFEIINISKEWAKVKLDHDGYSGFISNTQFDPKKSSAPDLDLSTIGIVREKQGTYHIDEEEKQLIAGCIYATDLNQLNDLFSTKATPARNQACEMAIKLLETPYLWGGRSSYGVDCSGLTQLCYRVAGYNIPRDAHQQAEQGTTVVFVEEVVRGDLAFFDNEEGSITHVGLCLGENKIIHAHGMVRVDHLDQQGIFNTDRGVYTHNLRIIKSYLPDY